MHALTPTRFTGLGLRPAPWHWAVLLSVAVHGLLLVLPASPLPHPASLARTGPVFRVNLPRSATQERTHGDPPSARGLASGEAPRPTSDSLNASPVSPPSQPTQDERGALYLPASQLSVKPQFLRHKYPPSAMQVPDALSSPVPVRVRIDEYGDVQQVVFGEVVLSAQALVLIQQSFANMQFRPGMLGTIPVKSELVVEVQLEPSLPNLDL